MKVLILFAAAIAYSQAVSSVDFLRSEEWIRFKAKFQKNYNGNVTEEKSRVKTYLEKKKMIADHNAKYKKGLVSDEFAINEFADLSSDEFSSFYAGLKPSKLRQPRDTYDYVPTQDFVIPNGYHPPEFIDWTKEKGVVSAVKRQGKFGPCRSCWAFSAAGAVEGQHFRKHRKSVTLSPQNLIDCTREYGNNGCSDGLPTNAFEYIKANKGINTEKSYPYKGRDQTCDFKRENVGSTIIGYKGIRSGDEMSLQAAVASIGPISAVIDSRNIESYSKGVHRDPPDTGIQLDHAVLVVGYGKEKNGEKYWLVKNTWGQNWGEKGYIKIARNDNNECGIASLASYPIM